MNNKTLISFLALMVVVIIAFLAISTFNETSWERSYDVTVLRPSTSYQNFKSFQPKGRKNSSAYPQVKISPQNPFTSESFLPQATKENTEIIGMLNSGGVRSSYRQSPSALSSGSASGMFFPESSSRGSLNTTGKNAITSSPGVSSTQGIKPYASNSNELFSGAISPGLPDPGGNIDNSGDDDIVFLPVPDGLFFMIFLSFIYALIKLIRANLKGKSILNTL